MNYLIETSRLGLRELTPGDARHFLDLNADPEVVKYTGDPPFESIESAKDFLEKYDQYEKYGYGRWAVILKKSGEFLGWCGLKYLPELDESDLGFRFFRKYWNQGYATEAAKACIEFGFKKLNLKRIVGRAMAANVASVRVLEKCGFHFLREIDFEQHPGKYFYLDVYELDDENSDVTIREEMPADRDAIFEVNKAAFGQEDEGRLVNRVREGEHFVPGLSLVAEMDGQVVGHILFSKIQINHLKGQTITLALAPVTVLPAHQRKGIGKMLNRAGLRKAYSLGFTSVIVLGHPEYYPKFGFEKASKWSIRCPFEVTDAAFMAIELVPGSLEKMAGTVSYPAEFQEE